MIGGARGFIVSQWMMVVAHDVIIWRPEIVCIIDLNADGTQGYSIGVIGRGRSSALQNNF